MVKKKNFNTGKILLSFFYVAIYLVILLSVYIVGVKMGDVNQALFVDKFITYVFIYFYVANIFKNLRILLPNNKPISFLDYVFHLEILKRIPSLSEWLEKQKEQKQIEIKTINIYRNSFFIHKKTK